MSRKPMFLMVAVLVMGVAAGSAFAELIAYWPFEDGQGTTAVDATGNGNDGTLSNGVEWVPGYQGWAVRFDTAGERIVVGPLDPTAANNAMTLAAWINWEGQGHSISQQGIIGKRLGWDPGTGVKWFWQTNPAGDLLFRADNAQGGTGLWWGNALLVPYANEWIHVALTWDDGAAAQYINGEEVSTGSVAFRDTADDTPMTIGCVDSTNTETFVGTIDEVRIYDTALASAQLEQVMLGDFTSSTAPVPADGSTDVPQDVILSWSPGDFAATHDVYFGPSFDDVATASRANPMGVLLSQDQTALTYDPPGLLEFSQTYYWRVDEVNAPPDSTIYEGRVWSFTVEPYVYPIANITATAFLADEDSGPEKTVDGSGLGTDDRHSIQPSDMWLASAGPEYDGPVWIQYEFDRVYSLYDMKVWNYNVQFERILGLGLKDVTIEYSIDGVEWTTFGDVEFAQGTSRSDYVANTTVDLRDVTAQFVRFIVQSNWNMGAIQQYGLSEVRFTHLPVHAREPRPAHGQAGVGLDVTLDWRGGRQAAAHELYFSADRAAVADGTALIDTLSETRYALGDLNFGSIYYWKVNEVNEAGPSYWEGDLWSFSTIEYALIEGFESYTDDIDAGEAIFDTWLDGWVNETGSTVGYLETPFAERRIVHSGAQSMPLFYDNTDSPYYSEAERTFDSAQNWTVHDADTLRLFVAGVGAAFYEADDGTIILTGAGTDIWENADEFRYAYRSLSGDGSMTVRVLSNGVGTNLWAKGGVMIRQNLDAGAINVMGAVTGGDGDGGTFQWRSEANGASDSSRTLTGIAPPYWVRLTRQGNIFTVEMSADGEQWQQQGDNPVTIAMQDPVLIGLAVTSHASGELRTFEFDSVSTTGNVTGNWQVADVGVEQGEGNAPAPLYVALEDATGREAVVTHPDPMIVVRSGWHEWAIPYSDLTGIDMVRIRTMYIGVGDRNNPTAGGTGTVYIDTIQIGQPGSSDPGTSGLAASYSLENDAEDGSGNGRNGTLMGEPTVIDGPAGYGAALLFDGLGGQYVHLGTWNPSAATGQLSVCLWANWNGLSEHYQGLIAKRDSWAADDMMWQLEANRDSGAISFARNGSSPASGSPVLPIGEWTHVAATFDGTTARLYVNAEVTGEGGFSFGSDPEAAVVFGACQGNGENPFNGALDEVHIYDRALSPFEINYLAGK